MSMSGGASCFTVQQDSVLAADRFKRPIKAIVSVKISFYAHLFHSEVAAPHNRVPLAPTKRETPQTSVSVPRLLRPFFSSFRFILSYSAARRISALSTPSTLNNQYTTMQSSIRVLLFLSLLVLIQCISSPCSIAVAAPVSQSRIV